MTSYVPPDPFFCPTGPLVGTPAEGKGDRCIYCDQYAHCLNHAAAMDWPGFHCRSCSYPYRGKIYDLSEFDLTDDEDTLYFPTEGQIDGLLTHHVNQEDIVIAFIVEGLIDED